mmetsp:Transcript_4241/g.8835  ORF Transcript_4241/g.8835 Transcript_4241/m.8835 type:complete len:215 (+) Transcript_4241:384-1028(+)
MVATSEPDGITKSPSSPATSISPGRFLPASPVAEACAELGRSRKSQCWTMTVARAQPLSSLHDCGACGLNKATLPSPGTFALALGLISSCTPEFDRIHRSTSRSFDNISQTRSRRSTATAGDSSDTTRSGFVASDTTPGKRIDGSAAAASELNDVAVGCKVDAFASGVGTGADMGAAEIDDAAGAGIDAGDSPRSSSSSSKPMPMPNPDSTSAS